MFHREMAGHDFYPNKAGRTKNDVLLPQGHAGSIHQLRGGALANTCCNMLAMILHFWLMIWIAKPFSILSFCMIESLHFSENHNIAIYLYCGYLHNSFLYDICHSESIPHIRL